MKLAAMVSTLDGLLRSGRPRVMGILNVTPDSFSDGGRHLVVDDAVAAALRMESDGADILDVGAVSTRPGAEPVSVETERDRLLPVLEALGGRLEIPVSVDTDRACVFAAALDRGAAILNDVTALRGDPEMASLAASAGCPVVLMHMRGHPRTMQDAPRYDDVVEDLKAFFEERMAAFVGAGGDASRCILDPGIGFGKTLEHNLAILARIDELKALGRPVLLGCSRKSFLGRILDRSEPLGREYATAATTARAFHDGVDMVRVHDVRAAVDVIEVLAAIRDARRKGD